MKQLRTLKIANALRKLTDLRPVLRCKTRWSGAFNMTSRYLQLKGFIKQLVKDGVLEKEFDMKETKVLPLEKLFGEMGKFNSVMVALQSTKIDLLHVRKLFDYTIRSFPSLNHYLASDAQIVHSPEFEKAIVALLGHV